jgi:hypothetical protein
MALTACRDRETEIWGPKSMVYFFPHALQPRCYTEVHRFFYIIRHACASSNEGTQDLVGFDDSSVI